MSKFKLASPVSLAPMAGITDYVLRNLIRRHSKTCLLTTEMISSEMLVNLSKSRRYKNKEFWGQDVLKKASDHNPIAYQLSGHKPELMAISAKILAPYADIIDINMGCPVNKVVKSQDGSALMRTPELAADLVKAIKDSVDLPVSVKFRLGFNSDEMNFVEFGQKMVDAGADFITLHARTRAQMYSGDADWEKIALLKAAVGVPVFANGDVVSIESAKACLEASCADGVALGRGVLGNVDLIARIEHFLKTGEKLPEPSLQEKITILKEHLDEEIKLRGEAVGIKFCRKFYAYYIHGVKDASKYRNYLVNEKDYDKIIDFLTKLQANGGEISPM